MSDEQIIADLIAEFPGLVDGETEVNGADLVQALTVYLSTRSY